MPTINEMIANPVQYGYIGGQRQRQADTRTQQQFETEQKSKTLDIARKTAEYEDYLAERKMRRKQAKAKELQADREVKYAGLLDEQARANILNATTQSFSQMHSTQIEDFARQIGGIQNQKQYKTFFNKLTDQDKQALQETTGFAPTGDFKKDKSALKYIHDIGVISMEHNRALELAGTKARASASNKTGAKPGPAPAFGPGSEPQLNNVVTQDPFFAQMIDPYGMAGPANDELAAKLTSNVMQRANEIIINSNNEARAAGNPGLQVGQSAAWQQAMQEEKALRHKVEDGKIVPMSIQEFNKRREIDIQSMEEQLRARYGAAWDGMNDIQKARILTDGFRSLRLKEYKAHVQKLNEEQ
jgi:hypothetical protein